MRTNGRVQAAANAKGFDSLDKLAEALLREHPKPFKGLEARSLAVRLGAFNRGQVTWWRRRPQAAAALAQLTGMEVEALIEADAARKRGLWSFEDFPELGTLHLAESEPADIAQAKALESPGEYGSDLESWFAYALGCGNEHRRLAPPEGGIAWLHVPSGRGMDLLLARIEAHGRVPVVRADNLSEACAAAPHLGPVVLVPVGPTDHADLLSLAPRPSEQPVLVVSRQGVPKADPENLVRTTLPSWGWLVATPSLRSKLSLGWGQGSEHGGIWDQKEIRELELRLNPDWRESLLTWVERRLDNTDSQFSAHGLLGWLHSFDPDEVYFPNPRSTLALARLCHPRGEGRLPKTGTATAGAELLRKVGHVDSRYLHLLKRLTQMAWVDNRHPWDAPRPWEDWVLGDSHAASPAKRLASRRRSGPASAASVDGAPGLATGDGEAALELGLLVQTASGQYRFRSQAEASLMLRDLLLSWIQAGNTELWAAPTVGDAQRQQLIDAALRGVESRTIERLCLQSLKAEPLSPEAIGATEAVFVAAGLRMAEGKLSYSSELGRLFEALFATSEIEAHSIVFPLGRTLEATSQRLDWVHACWAWSLHHPRPSQLPAMARDWFPMWGQPGVDFLAALPSMLASTNDLPGPEQARIAPLARTAAKLASALQPNLGPESAAPNSPAMVALVCLTQAAIGSRKAEARWWSDLHTFNWAPQALDEVIEANTEAPSEALAASLLEACAQPTGHGMMVLAYLQGPLWRKLLTNAAPQRVLPLLSPQAYRFAIENAVALPQAIRTYIAHEAPIELLRTQVVWDALLTAGRLPSEQRLTELLEPLSSASFGVATWLWRHQPDRCMGWAADAHQPMHRMLLEHCPDEHALAVLKALPEEHHQLTPLFSSWPEWISRRVARSGAQAAELLKFLGHFTSGQAAAGPT
jgi:hypothetical protein